MTNQTTSMLLDVEEIYATPPDRREPLIERFLSTHAAPVNGVAGRLARQYGLKPSWRDEAFQIVRICCWEVLGGPKDPKVASNEIFSIVTSRARNEMTRLVQSSDYTGVSGTTAARRRQSAVRQHARRMSAVLGYEPSTAEAVGSYNERVSASRSNPQRQGALASVADMELPYVVHDPDHVLGDSPVGADDVIDAAEANAMVVEVLRRCKTSMIFAGSDDGDRETAGVPVSMRNLGLVAEAALGGHLVDRGDFTLSVHDLVDKTHLSRTEVSRMVQMVRQVAIEVLDEMGVRP